MKDRKYWQLMNKLDEQKRKNYNYRVPALAVTVAVVSFIAGLFFLSANITGNAILNMTNSTSNQVGVILFIVGLICALTYFKTR